MSQSTTTAATPAEATPASLSDHPVFIALVAYLDAMRALSTFPSSPVPPALDQAVVAARQAFKEALGSGFFAADAGEGAAYDDAWIRQRFESLDEALKGRFEAVDKAIESLASHEADGRAALAERLRQVEAVDLKGFASSEALQGLDERVAGIEEGSKFVVSADFDALDNRVTGLEQAATPAAAPTKR